MKLVSRFFLFLLVFGTVICATGCGCNGSPGSGEKIGQIVKVSEVGMMSKTFEGQLIRGGMTGGSGTAGTPPFDFTIESEEMAQKAREYMQSQTEVVIHYRTEFVYSEFRTENGGVFLTSIEPAKKDQVPTTP